MFVMAGAVAVLFVGVNLDAKAVGISNLGGQSCGEFSGTWHFVNNQVPQGSGTGTLTATWDSEDSCKVLASKVNGSTQHFYCTASGALTSVSTNLSGRLLLSELSCETKCEKDCK
jgi:hypothetical protein